jgi:sugar O-acyltransferase (sialic acid O-acetyltransferase NeuD family)
MRGTELILVGGGEHARAVAEAASTAQKAITLLGYTDSKRSETLEQRYAVRWLGDDESISAYPEAVLILAVGAVKAADSRRRRIVGQLSSRQWGNVVHGSAVVSTHAQLAEGAIVMAGAIVQPGAVLGPHCLVGSGAIIEHDVMIGEFSIVGPGAVIGGGATIDSDAFVGLGARIRDHRRVGARAMVGMGAVVVADVSPGDQVIGVPAAIRARVE